MWAAKAKRKNYYIHSIFPGTDPIILNNFVEQENDREENSDVDEDVNSDDDSVADSATKRAREKSEYSLVAEFQNNCLSSPADRTECNMAYGLLGLKKLIVDISSSSLNVDIKLLKMLSEELKNKENCFRAINNYDIIRRLSCLMSNFYEEDLTNFADHIQEILTILETLSLHYTAATLIFHNKELMKMLLELISHDKCFGMKSLKILLAMSNHSAITEKMIEEDYFTKIKNILIANESLLDAYEILANLVQFNSSKAIAEDLFEFLYNRIFVDQQVQPVIMKCFAILINSCEAQKLCDREDLVYKLTEILRDENLDLRTAEYAVLALQNTTLSTSALWRSREFWDLPMILIRRAYNKENDRLQLFSLQALRQITQHPCIKDFVRKVCKRKIKAIYCRTEYSRNAKENLLQWLRRKCYINKEPESDTEDYKELGSDSSHEDDLHHCDSKFRM